ncbi:MAG: hypothetical protein RI947_1334 [Candidatus Parcubacteria bacterium]|jgi:hypothetical protein
MEHYYPANSFARQLRAVYFFIKRRVLQYVTVLSAGAMIWGSVAMPAVASTPTLFGNAAISNTGYGTGHSARLSSSNSAPGYGGLDFSIPPGTTFEDVQTLSLDYNITDDDCKAGSPRFQINVDTGKGIRNILVYIGPEPKYTGCTQNTWKNTGNLLSSSKSVDTTQLAGGTFYDPYSAAVSKYGSMPVVGMQLMVDSGYAFPDNEETVLVDNVFINQTPYTFETKVSKDN